MSNVQCQSLLTARTVIAASSAWNVPSCSRTHRPRRGLPLMALHSTDRSELILRILYPFPRLTSALCRFLSNLPRRRERLTIPLVAKYLLTRCNCSLRFQAQTKRINYLGMEADGLRSIPKHLGRKSISNRFYDPVLQLAYYHGYSAPTSPKYCSVLVFSLKPTADSSSPMIRSSPNRITFPAVSLDDFSWVEFFH